MARISDEMISLILDGEKDASRVRFLQIRKEIRKELDTQKYPIRVDISWCYEEDHSGMPQEEVASQMEQFEDAIMLHLEKNNLALLAYQLTGEGERLWSFYTRNIGAFQEKLNEATEELPTFPLSFYAEEDREAEAFAEVETLME